MAHNYHKYFNSRNLTFNIFRNYRSPQGLRGKRLVFHALLHNPSLISAEFRLIWGLVRAELVLIHNFLIFLLRSAEEAAPAEDDKVYGTGHNSYVGQTIWGFPKVKRSAEEVEAVAEEAAAPAAHVAVAHPYFGYYGHQLGWPSFRAPGFSSQCFGCRGKRSAEAEPGYGYYGYPAYRGYYGHPYLGAGVAGHPTGTSYSHRSPQGLGK